MFLSNKNVYAQLEIDRGMGKRQMGQQHSKENTSGGGRSQNEASPLSIHLETKQDQGHETKVCQTN